MDRWLALVNVVMKPFGPHKMHEIFRIAEEMLASQERLCSMESVSRSVSQSTN